MCARSARGTGKLTPGIEIKQTVHLVVHEPEHDQGRQSRSCRNSQHIRQQCFVVPTEMAISTLLGMLSCNEKFMTAPEASSDC